MTVDDVHTNNNTVLRITLHTTHYTLHTTHYTTTMTKKRKTVSLDPEVKTYLDSNGRNASETVNNLVKMEMGEDAINEQLIRMRIQMEKDRYEDAAQKARGHLERYNHLQERLEQQQEAKQSLFDEAREALAKTPRDPENPGIQNWADKLDLTPEELLEKLD